MSDGFKMLLFADDTNIFARGADLEELSSRMNAEMIKLYDWLKSNRLSLNISKTHYMVFNPKTRIPCQDIKLFINGRKLEEVKECKFLGVILDNKLSWKSHCSYIARKISKPIGIISKAKMYLEQDSLKTLYYSFVYPYLLYSNITW